MLGTLPFLAAGSATEELAIALWAGSSFAWTVIVEAEVSFSFSNEDPRGSRILTIRDFGMLCSCMFLL